MAEFVSINVACANQECPEVGTETSAIMRLTDSGDLPWLICGVCQVDIIPNPNAESTND